MAAPAAVPVATPAYQPVNQSYQQVPPPSAYAPAAPYVAAPPPQKSSSAVKIILIIVGVFVLLGVLAAATFGFFAWRVSRAIHVEGSGPNAKVTLKTDGGTFSANTGENYSASDLGTDIYPGATKTEGGLKMDLPTGSMISANFLTSDSKDQVLSFYKSKFGGSEVSSYDTANGAVVSMKKGENEAVIVTITAGTSSSDPKTKIAIVHTKSKK
jgi:hypothetical protein